MVGSMTTLHSKPRKARIVTPGDALPAWPGAPAEIVVEETSDGEAAPMLHRTHSDRVFEEIERALVNGEIPLGSRLGEEQLSARFGVSRGPMREALRRLEGRGLVVRLPHAGVRVVSLSPKDMAELYEIRASLEGLACRLAAQNMTEAEFDKLEALLQRHRDEEALQADLSYHQDYGELDFHYLLAKGCGSRRLTQLLCRDLYSLMRLFRFRTGHTPGRPLRAFVDHERILEAMRKRDDELAELLMKRHVAAAGRQLQAVSSSI